MRQKLKFTMREKLGYKRTSFLSLMLLVVFLKGLVWAFLVPVWHFPDEQAHFAQVSAFVETGKMPPHPDLQKNLSREIFISEKLLGTERNWAGVNKFTYNPEYNIKYTDSIVGKYEQEISRLPIKSRKVMVKKEAAAYPPLYYWISALGYKLAYKANLFTRVLAVRIINLSFILVLVAVSHHFFRQIFTKDKLLIITATILVAFHPMLTFVSSGVNSDNLFNLLFISGIYLSLRLLIAKTSFSRIKLSLFMLAILLLAMKTKPQGLLLLYVYLFPLVILIYKGLVDKRIIIAGIGIFVFQTIRIMWFVQQNRQIIPDVSLTSVIMPNLTFSQHFIWSIKHTYKEVVPWYWGVFKWLGVVMPRKINRIINWTTVISVVGLVVYIIRTIRSRDFLRTIYFSFLIYTAVGYYLILTVWDFLFTRSHGFSIGMQGRYFFPTLPVHMGLLLLGLISLLPWMKKIVAKITGLGMIIVNFIALYTIVASYYDASNGRNFFIQASQYKPWFAKSPYLEFWFILYGIIFVIFLYQYVRLSGESNVKKI